MFASPFPRLLRTPVFGAVLWAAALGLPGCGTQCERNPDDPPIPYTGGRTDTASGTYESAPAAGPYLNFPPGRTYRFIHGLGGVPRNLKTFGAFARNPLQVVREAADGFVEITGNQATYEAVTADYVDLRNDTCSAVRIRLVLGAPRRSSGGDGGAAHGDTESTGVGFDAATSPSSTTPFDAGN